MSTYEMLEHSPTQAKDEEFVLRDLVRMIVDQIWWVLGIALGILLVAVLYAKMSTPVYSADALVQVETPSPNSPNSAQASLAAALMPSAGSMHADAEIEIIKSRAVIDPVVEQFKLNFGTSANVMPVIGRVTSWFAHKGHPLLSLFGLDAYAWGGEEFKVDSVNVPTILQDQRLTLRALGEGRFALLDAENHELLQGEAGNAAAGDGGTPPVSPLGARPRPGFFFTPGSPPEAGHAFGGALPGAAKRNRTRVLAII